MSEKYTAAELHAEALSRITVITPGLKPSNEMITATEELAKWVQAFNNREIIIRHFYDYSWRARFGRWWRHKVLRKPEPKWWGNGS